MSHEPQVSRLTPLAARLSCPAHLRIPLRGLRASYALRVLRAPRAR
ncbi:hypothetical protein ABT218_25345 [Streptomyces sp. NPDC001455]